MQGGQLRQTSQVSCMKKQVELLNFRSYTSLAVYKGEHRLILSREQTRFTAR